MVILKYQQHKQYSHPFSKAFGFFHQILNKGDILRSNVRKTFFLLSVDASIAGERPHNNKSFVLVY